LSVLVALPAALWQYLHTLIRLLSCNGRQRRRSCETLASLFGGGIGRSKPERALPSFAILACGCQPWLAYRQCDGGRYSADRLPAQCGISEIEKLDSRLYPSGDLDPRDRCFQAEDIRFRRERAGVFRAQEIFRSRNDQLQYAHQPDDRCCALGQWDDLSIPAQLFVWP